MSAALENNLGLVTCRLSNGTHILIHNSLLQKVGAPSIPSDVGLVGSPTKFRHDTVRPTPQMYLESNDITSEDAEITENVHWCPESPHVNSLPDEILDLPEGYSLTSNSSDQLGLDPFGEIVISFKCRSCEYLSVDRNDLQQHFEASHGENSFAADPTEDYANEPCDDTNAEDDNASPDTATERMVYLCGECNEILASLDDCRDHMMESHNLILATDEEGAEEEEGREEEEAAPPPEKWLVDLKDLAPPENKFSCATRGCHFKFATADVLAVHARCHSDVDKTFRCRDCPETFGRWRACALHLWRSHGVDAGLFACPVCVTYKTATHVKLLNHVKTHGEARPYVCVHDGCGKSFKQPSQLRNHRVLHLDRKTVEVPRWYSSQKCDICSKIYADSKCLKKHIQAVHSKLRPYKCNVCGHASARKAMLQMHARQHTGEKPYNCDRCSYKTGDHNSLRRHKMRHTGARPYRCPHCPYAAIQSNSYKNHLRNKHPGMDGAYDCVDCDFRTVSEEAFASHVRDHELGAIPTMSAADDDDEVEYFPENEAAATMIYRCLNGDVGKWKANVTASATSTDRMSQTIMIRVPGQEGEGEARCYLTVDEDEEEEEEEEEEGVDTGGITIPAEPDGN